MISTPTPRQLCHSEKFFEVLRAPIADGYEQTDFWESDISGFTPSTHHVPAVYL